MGAREQHEDNQGTRIQGRPGHEDAGTGRMRRGQGPASADGGRGQGRTETTTADQDNGATPPPSHARGGGIYIRFIPLPHSPCGGGVNSYVVM